MYATFKSYHTSKVHTILLTGPVFVDLLKPIGADSLEDDAQQVFLQFIASHRYSRIEVIWDISLAVLTFQFQRGELTQLEAVLQQIQRPRQTDKSLSRLMQCCLAAT